MKPAVSLSEARRALDDGTLSAVALLDHMLDRLAELEPQVQSLVSTTTDLAREQAVHADRRLSAGERTPLLGIPVVVKDLVDVAGVRTTAGSAVLADNVATSSASAWLRLAQAGAVLIGKGNTHEFAYGGTTEPTRNPADLSRIVGGSSGGPAAALAAGLCVAAVGSDTAGSIRIPANLCGVAGLKPTRGLVPADGVVPLSPTLDVLGPMARTVADLAPVLSALAGQDAPEEPTPTRVGVLRTPGPTEQAVVDAVAATEAALRSLGLEITDVTLPGFADSLGDNFTIIGYEASRYHQRWAHLRHLYTPYVRDRLAEAAEVTEDDYRAALQRAEALGNALDRVLDAVEGVDAVLLAGVPLPASPAYDDDVEIAGEWVARDAALCRNTAFANLTGHPALAIPAGLQGDLPVGVQLVGRRGADWSLVALGARVEPLLPAGLPPHLAG